MSRGAAARLLATLGAALALGSAGAAVGAAAAEAESCTGAGECRGRPEAGGELSSLLQSHAPRSQPPQPALLSKAASEGITEIQQDYIVINGRGYSRYAAHSALLGSYGSEFKWTAYLPPRLSFTENPENSWLDDNTQFGTSVWIQSSQESSFDVSLATNAIPAVEIEAGLHFNDSHSAKFYLKELMFASHFELMQAMNSPDFAAKRKYMKEQMDRPRIVTAVWVLIEGDEEHSNFCAGGSLTLKFEKVGKIAVSGNGCRMSTWQFAPDSVMAYESSKVKFDKEGMVVSLEVDLASR